MKTKWTWVMLVMAMAGLPACEEENDDTMIGGDPSSMADVGTTYVASSGGFTGIDDLQAVVVASNDDVATLSASAVVTDPMLKNILSNFPEITLDGDTATVTSSRFKITRDGIAYVSGENNGIIARYGSGVGDRYPIGDTGDSRVVVSKSTTDDFPYGFYLIKVIQVEEESKTLRDAGIERMTYWANHRFGLVAMEITYGDGSTTRFTVYCSVEN